MRAVILAGGLGTRLRPYTTILPKPLVPVGERPILEHILRRLHGSGARSSTCASAISASCSRSTSRSRAAAGGARASLALGGRAARHGGALRLVTDLEGSFLVMNGDVLTTSTTQS